MAVATEREVRQRFHLPAFCLEELNLWTHWWESLPWGQLQECSVVHFYHSAYAEKS